MTIEASASGRYLHQLGLRRTFERQMGFALLLERPGLSATECTRELVLREPGFDHRTTQRLFKIFWSKEGCRVRLRLLGPRWVCWGCGKAVEDAGHLTPSISPVVGGGLPLDLGGYCAECMQCLTTTAPDAEHSHRTVANTTRFRGRASIIPVESLYENPNLMRELFGSNRRMAGRDYAVAILAENPQAGPTESRRLLGAELAISPSLRSLKRYSVALRGPKAQLLFASIGSMGWKCPTCETWGKIFDVSVLNESAPEGFAPTDSTVLCQDCYGTDGSSCRNGDR